MLVAADAAFSEVGIGEACGTLSVCARPDDEAAGVGSWLASAHPHQSSQGFGGMHPRQAG